MTDRYKPSSDFLKSLATGQILLSGSDLADSNLARLIALTTDDDVSNRDWATFLLATESIDTPAVRAALLAATQDPEHVVRDEALQGLALRDPGLARPLVNAELTNEVASLALFEAALLVAHPTLIPALEKWVDPSENSLIADQAARALAACRGQEPGGD